MKCSISTSLLCLGLLVANLAYAESDATKSRQKLFTNIEEQSEVLEDLIDDEKWLEAAPLAEELAGKVSLLNALFPDSSQNEGRARDAVWEEWPEFSDRLKRFESSFRDVAIAITKESYDEAEDALDNATSSCRSCHMSFRSLW
jgi:cytochrome c556